MYLPLAEGDKPKPSFLWTLDLRGPSAIGKVLQPNGRSVPRLALEYGSDKTILKVERIGYSALGRLEYGPAQSGATVYPTVPSEDGILHPEYALTSAPASTIYHN